MGEPNESTEKMPERRLTIERVDNAQKQHNDQVMLRVTLCGVIVSLAAAGAAFWSSFEARNARVEAGELGRKSLQLQSRSIDAQIQAIQADERPYLKTEPGGGTEIFTFTDADSQPKEEKRQYVRVAIPRIQAVVFGRTPALEGENHEDCTFFTNDGDYHLPEQVPGYMVMGTIFQGEKQDLNCNVGRMPIGAHLTKFSIVRFKGYVQYKSLIGGSTYRTPFCYEQYLLKGKITSCTAESPL